MVQGGVEMASTVWKGHLAFGLVSVPVRLVAAARPEKVSFHQVNPETGSRVKQKLFDQSTDTEVSRKQLVKASELPDGRTVYLTDDDLKSILPESSKTMSVTEFVSLDEVDPLYYDSSYYLLPDGEAGKKPYFLLHEALKKENCAGLAKMVRSRREYLVIVRPSGDGLALHTLFYEDEVREVAEYGDHEGIEIGEKELELAQMFVQNLSAPFEPEKYEDSYRVALEELLNAKAEGQTIETPSTPAAPATGDLMEALKASLGMSKKPPQAEPKEKAKSKTKAKKSKKKGKVS
jgi:DNA end-binding protein Ku